MISGPLTGERLAAGLLSERRGDKSDDQRDPHMRPPVAFDVAQNLIELPEDKANEILEIVDALEQDEDVQHVFHNLA